MQTKHYEPFDQWSLVSNESYLEEQRNLPKDQAAESRRHHRGIEYLDQLLPNVLYSSAYSQMLPMTEKEELIMYHRKRKRKKIVNSKAI